MPVDPLLEWMQGDGAPGLGVAVLVYVALAIGTTAHVLVHKESSRAAAGWVGLVWLSPVAGSLAYWIFGVNRVHRKAVRLRQGTQRRIHVSHDIPTPNVLRPLQRAVMATVGAPLVAGNRVTPLEGGETALPAMLEAIEDAQRSVALMTFIFDLDAWGQRFVDALVAAHDRGVEVRVLVDGVGTWFSWPSSGVPALSRGGVDVRRFLWSYNPLGTGLLNLRNHRKVLVVDGLVGFTGGMNIRGTFVDASEGPRTAEDDLHAKVEGPVVRDLLEVFCVDWAFESGERLSGSAWFPTVDALGDAVARVVPDGPDEDRDKAEMLLHDAVSSATERVCVLTPYFLPEDGLRGALCSAARRGVSVEVVVPWPSNHPMVDRAMRAELSGLLAQGVKVWAQPPPFDHSKLMVVDGVWACLGSANWDPRSLRLNFEMLLEVYDPSTATRLAATFDRKRARSLPFEQSDLEARGWLVAVGDGVARLFKPYL